MIRRGCIPRLIVGGVMSVAGVGKLFDNDTTLASLLADPAGVGFTVLSLGESAAPWIETIVGLALLIGWGTVGASSLAVLLSVMFVAYASLLPEGTRCDCFGLLGGFGSRAGHLAVVLGLAALSVLSLWAELRVRSVASSVDTSQP
ncbi:MAG: MauE/DoxX family redox-associated membrane protein [Dehalococcoidia bacterium]